MGEKAKKKAAFPLFTHYNLAIKYFVEKGLETEFILQPQMTRRTMEIGAQNSPDYVCTPFKSTLGSMIDALEAGADTLLMSMGLCRLGYYGELQERILRDMGYHFEMVNLAECVDGTPKEYLKALRRVNPKATLPKMTKAGAETLRMVACMDEIVALYYQNCGFETAESRGSFQKALNRFYLAMETADSLHDIEEGYREAKREFAAIATDKPDNPLRVGIIGEYFTAVDPFSNLHLEQKLANMGVEVHRWMNVTNRNLRYRGRNLAVQIQEYSTYEMGPTSTANIWCAKYYASHGFDGIVHAKSAGCTPETDIMPVLQNISADYKTPFLYLTYDSQTSDTGLDTRLEAFYDMIAMRKKVR